MTKSSTKVGDNKIDETKDNTLYRVYDNINPAFERSNSIISKKSPVQIVKKEEKVKSVGMGKLFSYATTKDRLMIFVAVIMSMGMGICWPMIIYVFGHTTGVLTNSQYYLAGLITYLQTNNVTISNSASIATAVSLMTQLNSSFVLNPKDDVFNQMIIMAQQYAAISLAMLIMSYISVTLFVITSQNQIAAIRNALFRAILRQDMSWFDKQNSGALNNKLTDDINTVHAGMGDQVGQMIQWYSCCIAGIVLAFVSGWKLSLVTFSTSPLSVITMMLFASAMMKFTQQASEAYGKAGGIAEEVLGAIRTIVSFRGEKYEVSRYASNLDDACRIGIKKSIITGTLLGLINGLLFASYSLGFWYGSKLIREGSSTMEDMLIVFFSCLIATMGLGQGTPNLSSVNQARNVVAGIFEIIDRVPEIDKMSKSGKKLENFTGKIEFKNVNFKYPTRSDCPILKNLSLNIEPSQTVALVGSSGCGKSSLIQLIQRFYDTMDGELLIDGINIKDINVHWLREQIGVVSQEPVLFDCNIRENIRYGRMDVTEKDIIHALEMANAKGFIDTLPDGLDTFVGDRGTQLSGGQKQRIAIARALVRNPKILLLDEATSALDSESERIVQEALDKVCIGRTTVIVAHRLSTVRNANVIFGLKDGKVSESGNHDELIALNGLYKELVDRQNIDNTSDEILKSKNFDDDIISPTKSLASTKYSIPNGKVEMESEKKKTTNNFMRIMNMNGPEKWYILLGCIGALFSGAAQPSFSVVYGYLIPALANPDPIKQQADVQIYVIVMAGIALIVFLANIVQNIGFGNSGERLTKRCRRVTFEAMLKQNIGWFDSPENNIGALTTRLSDEASAIRGISGESLGAAVLAISSLGAAIVVSFIYCWQISLCILAFVPVIFIGGILQIKITQGFSNSDKGALEESGKIAVECIENVRTVSNLTREETFIEQYAMAISRLTGDINKKAHIQGFLFGITQASIFCAFAATFIMAGYLIKNNITDLKGIFISFGALIFGAMNFGKAMGLAPDFGKGKLAAAHMFELLDRVPPIDSNSTDGFVHDITKMEGRINVDKVQFSYPLRPDVMVMKDVSFNVKPNKTIALVGPSGCGKSTIIQLLQRFYDTNSGNILIDKTKIPKTNIKSLRQIFSIVSQEPTLFSYSIRENIAYADIDNICTDEEIEAAAKASNIHDFIISLPDKYKTKVGEKGSNFSGGQKQRIAIARALLRNPKILLLDEATSALDTESEKVVQEALDKAQEGRTCLVIAHRLSTIQNADKILVFKEGKIAESGTHSQLLKQNGIYCEMIRLQSRK